MGLLDNSSGAVLDTAVWVGEVHAQHLVNKSHLSLVDESELADELGEVGEDVFGLVLGWEIAG